MKHSTANSGMPLLANHFLLIISVVSKQGLASVDRWTKRVNIFDYEYIVIPVHWAEYVADLSCVLFHMFFPVAGLIGFWSSSFTQQEHSSLMVIQRNCISHFASPILSA
jgi:Ulp1 family protease